VSFALGSLLKVCGSGRFVYSQSVAIQRLGVNYYIDGSIIDSGIDYYQKL